jgi:hypothetical protein
MKRGDVFSQTTRIAAILILMGAAGCGRTDDLPRQPVWGQVSFDGKPLDQAWIEFRPEGEGGITAAGAQILGGSYSIPLADGLIPGKYRVAINKAEAPTESEPEPKPNDARLPKGKIKATRLRPVAINPFRFADNPFRFAKQLIPDRYNTKSDIIQEVKADQTNEFNFELTSK